jgi:LAS superfamily LD-carboxypeptidase LdcB
LIILGNPKCNQTLNQTPENMNNKGNSIELSDFKLSDDSTNELYISPDIALDSFKCIDSITYHKNIDTLTQLPFLYNPLSLLGQIKFACDTNFVPVLKYTEKEGIFLRRAAYESFVQMADSAALEGIRLNIISAGREFNHQKAIWETKWTTKYNYISNPTARAKEILNYSAMPGSSRHHWGTEVDINALSNAYFSTGEGKKTYDWMLKNAARFGYCQVYNNKNDRNFKGYNEERWHWSYMPLSTIMLEDYLKQVDYSMIKGFLGEETAPELQIIENYVKAISSGCH